MSTLTVPKPEERARWLAARHPYFNASDAGVLYGVHPFRSLADVAVEKLQPEANDDGETEAMERGTRLEPVILDWFGDRHGCSVTTPDVLFVHGRLMATLDGEIAGENDEWIEVKTTAHTWSSPPEHVYWQVVAQAAASGRKACHVVWIDADMRYKEQRIVPEPEHVTDVLQRAAEFMDFVDLGMLPEGVQMTAEHLARLYPAPKVGIYADIDDAGLQAIVHWEQLRRQRVRLEKDEKAAKDVVANLVAEAEACRYDGTLVLTWRANKSSEKPDWKALTAEHPLLVESFTREVPGARVLRATKQLVVDEATPETEEAF